ncbi:MAG: hypothetical protein WD772_12750 [Pseudohongiellaceae bacterium]
MSRRSSKSLITLLVLALVGATTSITEILTHQSHQHETAIASTIASPPDTGHFSHQGEESRTVYESAPHHEHLMTTAKQASANPDSGTQVNQEECVCDDICCAVSAMSLAQSPRLTDSVNSVQIVNNVASYTSISLDLLIPPPETQSA